MGKVRALLLLLVVCIFSGHVLYAQHEDEYEEDPGEDGIFIESDWDGYIPDLYSLGDQVFNITLGTIFPAVFFHDGNVLHEHNFLPVGGTGSLAYTFFLGPNYFVGGEIGFKFNYTRGGNVLFFVPIGLRGGYQFIFRRFEFPLTFTIGGVPQSYRTYRYLGLFLRGSGAAYYRLNPDWSFGLNFDWSWYPQWVPNDERGNVRTIYANIIGVTLTARYHF